MSNATPAGESYPPAHANLITAWRVAEQQAEMAAGVIRAARSKSLGMFLIALAALRRDPNPLAAIDPVMDELNAASTYPTRSCAHRASVQLANDVCLAIYLAFDWATRKRESEAAGVGEFDWFPNDRLIVRHFAKIARRVAEGSWPDVECILAECERELSKAILARTPSRPRADDLLTFLSVVQLGKKQRQAVEMIAAGGDACLIESVGIALDWGNDTDNWNSMRKELNRKFATHGWRFETAGGRAVARRVKRPTG